MKDEALDKHSEKIEQIRDVLVQVEQGSLESLLVIDTIQRLGLGYLFEEEIKAALLHHHDLASKPAISDDLHKVALRFRLLRQQGFHVSANEFFMGFKGEDGEFKGKVGDTKGVMAMYESSHLRMEGEDILHEAAIFCSHYLITLVSKLGGEEGKMVTNCLLYPQHKTLPCSGPHQFLQSMNDEKRTWAILLQEAAHFESAILHSQHKLETLQVVEWWEGAGLRSEVKWWRDQPEKWHMWSTAVMWDPSWSQHRILLTKPISLVYVVDDIFDDLHATVDQLFLLTQALNKWEICAALPSYMKTCLTAIYDSTHEISLMVHKQYGWNPFIFLKKEWGKLVDAFWIEAKWLRSGEMPKGDEYLKNGVITSGVPMVLSHLFFLMGNPLTHQTQILLNDPCRGITFSVAKLLRLLDDLEATQEEKKEDGLDGSYVECYMREEDVGSIEAAREHVIAMVSDTWRDLNQQALSSISPFSATFRHACLNAARMVPTMYNYHNTHALHLKPV